MTIETHDIRHADLFGIVARPERPNGAGILILPTIYGLNPVIRGIAASFAAQGYVALVWDPYRGVPPKTEFAEAHAQSQALRDEPALEEMSGWVERMTGAMGLKSVATLGYCLGGRYVFMLAARDRRLKACVGIYPSIEAPMMPHQTVDAVAVAAEIRCPTLLSYPGRDHVTSRDTFQRLQQTLEGRAAPSVILHYPEADHGFMWRTGEGNEAAARAARPQVDAFLAASLL